MLSSFVWLLAQHWSLVSESKIDLFAVMLTEDDILREALQEIWEMQHQTNPHIQDVFRIVNDAAEKITAFAASRRMK